MKVNDFITDIGNMLGEDFIYSVVWSRSELLGYVQHALKQFAELTLIVDQDSLRAVASDTGEANVPADFSDSYYLQYDDRAIELVNANELDFITGTWLYGTTGTTPLAATIYGSGDESVVRVVPIPSDPVGAYGATVVTSLILHDAVFVNWTVTVDINGVLTTALGGAVATNPLLVGPSACWWIRVDAFGVLYTVMSAASSGDWIVLTDPNGVGWTVTVDDSGNIITTNSWGKVVRLEVNGVNQEFSSDYGIIVDAYVQSTTTTPAAIVRLTSPYGMTVFGRVSEDALHVWYKGLISDVNNTESEIYLSEVYIPVLQHGVLALAYNHDGVGRDAKKAQVLSAVFKLECESIRRMFQKK